MSSLSLAFGLFREWQAIPTAFDRWKDILHSVSHSSKCLGYVFARLCVYNKSSYEPLQLLLTFDLLLNRDRLRIKAEIAAKLKKPEDPPKKIRSRPRFFIIGHDRSRADKMIKSETTRGSTCVDIFNLPEGQSQSTSGPILLTAIYSVNSKEGELWSSQSTAKHEISCSVSVLIKT